MPTFSDALYYPTIDIENSSWLKTAVLFWDSISTIVPESLHGPYNNDDARYLQEEGFLKPLRVNSDDESVISIEEDFIKLLDSPELNIALHNMPIDKSLSGISAEKMSHKLGEKINQWQQKSNSLFDDDEVRELAQRLSKSFSEGFNRDGFYYDRNRYYYIDSGFANLYMMTLAEKLSERYSLAMVTDTVFSFDIGNRLRMNNAMSRFFQRNHYSQPRFAQSLLLEYVINGLSISPGCDLKKIMRFRREHRDELGNFKNELQKLTQGIDTNQPFDAIRADINNTYENSFTPAFNNLKKALYYSSIKWATETFIKVALYTTSTTSVQVALMGMPVEQALFAGAGLSIIASLVSYNVNKREALLNNPYSYLLSIQREFPSGRRYSKGQGPLYYEDFGEN